MRVCQKENCSEPAIKRGKFCETHCTVRRRRASTNIVDDELVLQRLQESRRIEEEERRRNAENEEVERRLRNEQYQLDRLLREEQSKEYEEALRLDRERIDKQREIDEKNRHDEYNREIELQQKRQRIFTEDTKEKYYRMKFSFPNIQGLSIISTFSKDCLFLNIFDFLDVFMNDSGINFEGFDIISYPNHVFDKSIDSDKEFSSFTINKNVQFTVKEKEKN